MKPVPAATLYFHILPRKRGYAKRLAPHSSPCYLPSMPEKPPPVPADHTEAFAHRWADRLEQYCALRMEAGPGRDRPGA